MLYGLAVFACALPHGAFALTPNEILAQNTLATVYLEVRDANNGVVDRGSGFVVSHDGYIVTVAHMKVDPTQKMWAVIGAREGTRFPLNFRDSDERSDVAIWQLPLRTHAAAACGWSIECSKLADAKGLHGKERKKFRSKCKLGKS